jgi:PAS domain S-box-containing protein
MDMWPGIENTEVFKIIEQVLEKRVPVHTENEFIFPDGSLGSFDLSIQPVPEGVFILSIDITERKIAEKARRESEEKYRLVSDNSDDWIYWVMPDGHLHYVSPACERVTGYSPDEFIIRPELYQEIIYESDREIISQHTRTLTHDDTPHHLEFRIVTKEGEIRWISHNCSPIFGKNGEFLGRHGTNHNITELKLQEEQLYESEFRFNKLYENGPFGMVISDSEFRFVKANPAFCAIMGYSEAELQKMTFKDLSEPDDVVRDLDNVRKLINKEISVYKTEKRYIRKDGQIIWGSLTVTATYDSNGQFLYNLGLVEDITRRKYAEEKIIQLNERISTATRASQVGIWDWDIKNNLLAWDEQMNSLYGLNKEEFTGTYEAWINGVHPDDRTFFRDEVNLALQGEKEYEIEFRIVWPNGTIRYSKAKGEVFRNEHGDPVRMVGINYDITEQKNINEKIREKDMEFRKLSANVPDLIYQFTRKPDGTYFVPIASEGIRNIFGCSPEDVLNDFAPIARVIYPEDADRVIRDIEYSAEHLSHFSCEFRVQIPGREIQWIFSNSSPERLPDGSITWYGFNVDITQKKMDEEALRYQTTLLSEVGRIAKVGGWEFSAISGESSWTEEVARIQDLDPQTPASVSLSIAFYTDQSRPIIEKSFREAVEQAKPYDLELEILTPKGNKKWVRTIGHPVVENGKVIKVFGSLQDITDQKEAQESLRVSEEKLRAIFDVLPFGISLIDNVRTIAQMNSALERIIKLSYTDIEDGKHKLRKYLRSDGSEMPSSELASSRAIEENRVIQDVETGIQTENGTVFWTSVSAAPLKVEGLSAVVITIDITARKQAEEALKLSEAQYRNIFESAVIGIYRTSPDGKILMANPTLVKMLGFSSFDELAKRNLKEQGFETNSLRDDFRKHVEESGSLTGYESVWKKADGTIVIVNENVRAFYNSDGEVIYYEGTVEDITERKRVEKALRESEEIYRKALKTSPDSININRLEDGMYISINQGFTDIMEYSEADVLGKTSLEINIWNNAAERKQLVNGLNSKGFVQNLEAKFRSKNGRLIDGLMSAAIIEIEGIPHIISITRDITDRKKAESEIRQLNETLEERVEERTAQLREANRELESFSYSVSHDLRSPLRHINGFAEILTIQFSDQLPEEARTYLNKIIGAAKKMGVLIDDLLSFSRTGRAELKISKFNMNQIIEDASAQIDSSVKSRKIEWEISPLPEIHGDYNLLLLVWINLLDNALKYTLTREVAVIQIGFNSEKSEIVFFIKDNGVGFDMKYADKLFGVFQRLHTSSQFDGTGIGLANVKRIISRHGGRVWAEAEPDKGATFYFSIPK